MKTYLIDFEKNLARQIYFVEHAKTPLPNKRLILDFLNKNRLTGISVPRMIRQAGSLRLVAEFIDKDFRKATRKDYERFIISLKDRHQTEETIDTHTKIIKVFYKWLNKGNYPESVSWIKPFRPRSGKLPEDLLVEDEIKSLILAAYNLRDKAFIAALWESGARIGEIGTIQLKHLAFDDFGCVILVNGKTGQRRVRLVAAAPYLLEWINQHPKHGDPSANVWINIERSIGEQTSHAYFLKVLRAIAKRAGIKKPVNPHHFRHSRATYMAQFLTEAQMKEYFGWAQSSTSAARYVHLSGKQVDDAILGVYGLKKEEKKESSLKQSSCPRCKILNDTNHQYCQKCWLPLTPQAVNEVETVRQKDQEAMLAVMKLLEMAKTNPGIIQQTIMQTEEAEGQ